MPSLPKRLLFSILIIFIKMALIWDYSVEPPPISLDPIHIKSFQSFIRGLLLNQEGVGEIEGQLYWTQPLSELSLDLIIRSGDQSLFPNAFFETEGFPSVDSTIIRKLCRWVRQLIQRNLNLSLKGIIEETLELKVYRITLQNAIHRKFIGTGIGVLIYLLSLRKQFPQICTIGTELGPLIRQAKILETELIALTPTEFIERHPSYPYLPLRYRRLPLTKFRFGLLAEIAQKTGPFIVATPTEARVNRSFRILFDRCRRSGTRMAVGYFFLFFPEGGHANVLIVDQVEKTIERFEPNGTIFKYANLPSLDSALTTFAQEQGYRYISPMEFCPRIGAQAIERQFQDRIGWCTAWSLIYAEQRIGSPYLPRTVVAQDLLLLIRERYRLRTPQELEQWLTERIDLLFGSMEQIYLELSEYLDVEVKYVRGRLIYE